MPIIYNSSIHRQYKLNWDLLFQQVINSNKLLDKYPDNINLVMQYLEMEAMLQFNSNIIVNEKEYFVLELPFFLKTNQITKIEIAIDIENLKKYIRNTNIKKKFININKFPCQPNLILSDHYSKMPIILWKNQKLGFITLDGNHRLQYAQKMNKHFLRAYILNDKQLCNPNIFCDNFSYNIFKLWIYLFF